VLAFETAPAEAKPLLKQRIRDLGLRLEGSPVEKFVHQLYNELEAVGLARFRPPCYLSDEWACPDREPIIGIPFYLADPNLAALERAMDDIEDEHEIMMYLRHEAGHAFNYAYELYDTTEWHRLFGPFTRPYVDAYTPVPFSRRYVRHIAGWYAQKHPDEDFAETFAVWLTPNSGWRERYRGWPAMEKVVYVDAVARELADVVPKRPIGRVELPVEEMESTVEEFYKQTSVDEAAAIAELALDVDLAELFDAGAPTSDGSLRSAASLIAAHRRVLIDQLEHWTGVRRSLVRALVEQIEQRAHALALVVERERESSALVELVVYVTTLTMSYLAQGKFVPA